MDLSNASMAQSCTEAALRAGAKGEKREQEAMLNGQSDVLSLAYSYK